MTIRSKLFATVAMPLLTMTIGLQPALADAQFQPFRVAQAGPDELLKKRRQQEEKQEDGEAPREERRKERKAEPQANEEQPQRQAEPAEEAPRPSREERRKQREAEPQANDEQPQRQAEPAEEAPRPSREERRKQREAEQQKQENNATDQVKPSDLDAQRPKRGQDNDATDAAEKKRQREERIRQREADRLNAQQNGVEAGENGDQPADQPAEKPRRQSDKNARPGDEQARPGNDQVRPGDEQARPGDAGQPPAGEMTDEERARIRAERRKQREADGQQAEDPARPDARNPDGQAADQSGEDGATRDRPARDVIDKRSRADREKLARDPSKSDETVVLPVENGAAVLDSDKDADNRGNDDTRDRRRREREQVRQDRDNQPPPRTDADAQSDHRERRPSRDELNEALNERGRRVERAPEFNAGDLIDALTGNRPRVEETRNNRTVLDFGDEIVVRSDDRPRLRRDARDSYYEELPRGRTREVIERPNGMRVVTIYNRYGDVIQRTRINSDGEEYLMVYAPEVGDEKRPPLYDAGEDLPPMRLTVPVRDYIIDTSTDPDRNYYDFLAEPPVERVERTYSLDEVRNSARIRDKVRRIDLDTITFATGSAEVPQSQANTLRKVADAMLEVIDKDPGETFLIEGHTDAVGSDQSNLVLSDERAESVASLLTDVYEIPPENLVTQGYGERFLKVRTSEAEQENRRVTIRRVTPLVRPVAQK
jgi:outer membrane protein OmpA-like peptidoglycan-associated protein